MLIAMDIIGLELIKIDVPRKFATIGSCNKAKAPLLVKRRDKVRFRTAVTAATAVNLPLNSMTRVPIAVNRAPLEDRDFQFVPYDFDVKANQAGIGIYAHIVDCAFNFVMVRNDADAPLTVPRDMRLGSLTELDHEGCYSVDPEEHSLAALSCRPEEPDPNLETRLENGITVYREADAVAKFCATCDWYPELWKDKGATVRIPKTEHMTVPLIEGWEKHMNSLSTKPYPLSSKDKKVVDDTFDKLHSYGKMEHSTEPTPFGFPVFVVWKQVMENGKLVQKGRAVVDIRGLNKIVVKDSYPVPLQADLIASLCDCRYLTTVDAVSFFYQWLVAKEDRHKFTINSYRG